MESKHEAASKIKKVFINCVMLNHPNSEKEYVVRIDSSVIGISTILSQLDDGGQEGIVSQQQNFEII